MISLEALVMVALATIAVLIAYTKLSCAHDDPRITWLPEAPDDAVRESFAEANPAQLQR